MKLRLISKVRFTIQNGDLREWFSIKASGLFGINKCDEFHVDVLNKIFELLLTPVK